MPTSPDFTPLRAASLAYCRATDRVFSESAHRLLSEALLTCSVAAERAWIEAAAALDEMEALFELDGMVVRVAGLPNCLWYGPASGRKGLVRFNYAPWELKVT